MSLQVPSVGGATYCGIPFRYRLNLEKIWKDMKRKENKKKTR
jgi:hypothetical protein